MAGTLETLVLELGTALTPLEELLDESIFVKLGVQLPSAIAGDGTISAKLGESAAKIGELVPKITALGTAIGGGDDTAILNAAAPVITNIIELVVKLKETGDALHNAAAALPPDQRAQMQQFAETLAIRTLEYVTVGYLNEKFPSLTASLALIGLVDKEFTVPVNVVTTTRIPHIPRRFHFNRIPTLFTQPDRYFQEVFHWGDNDFNGEILLRKIHAVLQASGLPAMIVTPATGPVVLEAYFFKIATDDTNPPGTPPGLKLEFSLPGNVTFDQAVSFSDLWKGTVHVQAAFVAGIEALLRPPFQFSVKPPTGNVDLSVLLGLKAEKSSGEPVLLIGATGGSRLQAKSLGGSIGADAHLSMSGGEVLPVIQVEVKEGKLVIDFSEGDGFLQQILSGVHLEADFDLLGIWDPARGLRFQGSGGIELMIPVHLDLSVIKVDAIYVAAAFTPEAPIRIDLATQLIANLGPLVAVVDRMGVRIPITFPEDGEGNLGAANIAFNFLPPTGIGLSIDTGVIKGGGFLYLDFDKGEYFGALELSFQGVISLKAIGIINTKMPDGSNGFALLILITAEFTPIQLGFGFTLNGVGGLLAVNRSLALEALRAGVRTGAVNSILFPQDVVANITRIISDLKTIFPIVQGHFVIAPMAKLGWGTPTLISLELGIILDIPKPAIVIVGVLRCILPTEEAPILKLQVNFAGGIDFDEGLIWFDASIFDSSILVFTLTGDMALRIGWKNPVFVISVGGFHPAFHEVPPDLTGMRRIMLSLLSGDNPRLTAQIYFAITSNTVQSGARVELYAEAAGFNLYGYLGYDLLVQFSPFYFIAQIYAGLALRRGTSTIAGVRVYCELSGPTPWNANGEASLTILFFEITVGFNVTWGEDAPSQPLETEDVLKLVVDALRDDRNWKADLPANTNLTVTLKKIDVPDTKIVIHPFGILSASQKVVPLNLDINKFGLKKPLADTHFSIDYLGTKEDVKEEFAIANFLDLNDSEKLSRKSFEKMPSGIRFKASDATQCGFRIQKEVTYELSYVHKKKAFKGGLIKFFKIAFAILSGGSAISKNSFSVSKRIANNAPAKVEVGSGGYSVVNVSDLELHSAGLTASSEAEAYNMYNSLIKNNPSLKGSIQVVSHSEL